MAVTANTTAKPDDVLIVMDIWDGSPISGVAFFDGGFASFKRVYDEEAQGWSKTGFRLQRLTGPELAQFNELNERFLAWQKAYLAGNTAPHPLLTAAQVNTQVEFDRTFRTIVREHGYQGKRVLYISGLHIDISPQPGQRFPLTKFVPWAAFVQQPDGHHYTLEQTELFAQLRAQPIENPDQINLEESIHQMELARQVDVAAP